MPPRVGMMDSRGPTQLTRSQVEQFVANQIWVSRWEIYPYTAHLWIILSEALNCLEEYRALSPPGTRAIVKQHLNVSICNTNNLQTMEDWVNILRQ